MSVQLQAGFARVDITPAYPVPLAGYGATHNRISQIHQDPLVATCVAVSDGENTVLLYHIDLIFLMEPSVKICKDAIEKELGIPGPNVVFTATHTHSAPDVRSPLPVIATYLEELHPKLIAAARDAVADLDNATMSMGWGKTDRLNFVRRYIFTDGSYGGDNFGDFSKTIFDHETEADPTMQVLRFNRENKKDVLLVNWQSHPHQTGGSKKFVLSSDLIDPFRNAVEQEHGVLMSYCQGCAGNINARSKDPNEAPYTDYADIGHALARTLTGILDKGLVPLSSGKVSAVEKQFTGVVNHSLDAMVPKAKEICDMFNGGDRDGARDLAQSIGLNSAYAAFSIVHHQTLPETITYPVGAVSIGAFGYAWAPHELFDGIGRALKSFSPYEMTFVCGYSNGSQGYLPTVKGFMHGGYESDSCNFLPGTGEKLTLFLLDALREIDRR